jgi:NADH-quinone oxidoreductase chain G
MITVTINSLKFAVKEGISILEACRFVGLKIPRFCYHDTLSIAGNCRMCLVKIEDSDALIIACLTEITENIEVITEDPFIQKAREDVLDFLLLDHPLDCPICDQGGECDLQDQAKKYGNITNKFFLNKVTVEDKNFNPFIKTIMTRCIHCTRCVRFNTEIAGNELFGTLNRGNATEIGSYTEGLFDSEISANVIDLCPVGALTSKPYAFKSRPWELRSIETLDFTDSIGSNVYLNYNNNKILRIIPKFNEEINKSIISDKARFYYDAFESPTILKKLLYFKENVIQNAPKFEDFSAAVLQKISTEKCLFLINETATLELLQLLKKVCNKFPNITVRSTEINSNILNKNIYISDETIISSLHSAFRTCFLIAVNPRTESALLNHKIRSLNNKQFMKIFHIGYNYDSNLPLKVVNFDIKKLISFFKGKSSLLSFYLLKAKNPVFFFGCSLLEKGFSISFLKNLVKSINPSLIFISINSNPNSTAFSIFNIKHVSTNDLILKNSLFFFNCGNNIFLQKIFSRVKNLSDVFWFNCFSLPFNIKKGYQIPTSTIFEENGTFLNIESRPQKAYKVFQPNTNKIIVYNFLKLLFSKISHYNSVHINNRNILNKNFFFFKELLENENQFIKSADILYLTFLKKNILNKIFFDHLNINNYPIKAKINDLYKSNWITRNSKNLLLASQASQKKFNNFY